MNFIVESLLSLRPGAEWSLDGDSYDGLNWLEPSESEGGQRKPTKEELEAESSRFQKEWENKEYQRLRLNEYPSIEEQLDILYHQGYDGWKQEINKIKNKYPKS